MSWGICNLSLYWSIAFGPSWVKTGRIIQIKFPIYSGCWSQSELTDSLAFCRSQLAEVQSYSCAHITTAVLQSTEFRIMDLMNWQRWDCRVAPMLQQQCYKAQRCAHISFQQSNISSHFIMSAERLHEWYHLASKQLIKDWQYATISQHWHDYFSLPAESTLET